MLEIPSDAFDDLFRDDISRNALDKELASGSVEYVHPIVSRVLTGVNEHLHERSKLGTGRVHMREHKDPWHQIHRLFELVQILHGGFIIVHVKHQFLVVVIQSEEDVIAVVFIPQLLKTFIFKERTIIFQQTMCVNGHKMLRIDFINKNRVSYDGEKVLVLWSWNLLCQLVDLVRNVIVGGVVEIEVNVLGGEVSVLVIEKPAQFAEVHADDLVLSDSRVEVVHTPERCVDSANPLSQELS